MRPRAYYNEIDTFAASWLRALIREGHIADGEVDERSIKEVTPDDLRGYSQCHFFAGIGVWSYALRCAGWADDAPVWTGSCPCQPFSAAGKRGGTSDDRHLWPDWFRLIEKCRPPVVFGEQVASKDGLQWLDLVSADLEGADYAFGAADLCAAGLGAPHIRQRLYFVADTGGGLTEQPSRPRARSGYPESGGASGEPAGRRHPGLLADALPAGRPEGRAVPGNGSATGSGISGIVGHTQPIRRLGRGIADDGGSDGGEREAAERHIHRNGATPSGALGSVGHPEDQRPERDAGTGREARRGTEHTGELGDTERDGLQGGVHAITGQRASSERLRSPDASSPTRGFWADADWLPCRDGKARPVEPGTFPLAHGAPARVGRLRGYGNCIVPQVAEAFIAAYREARGH